MFTTSEKGPTVPVGAGIFDGRSSDQTTVTTNLKELANGPYNDATKRQRVKLILRQTPVDSFQWDMLVTHNDWTGIHQLLGLVPHGLPLAPDSAHMMLIHAVNTAPKKEKTANPNEQKPEPAQLQVVEQLCLLEIPGLINKKDKNCNKTAFELAIGNNNSDIAKILKDNGASVGVTGYLFASHIIDKDQVAQIQEIKKSCFMPIKRIAKAAFIVAQVVPSDITTTTTALAVRAFCTLGETIFYRTTSFFSISVPEIVTTLSVPVTLAVAAYRFNPLMRFVTTVESIDFNRWTTIDLVFAIGNIYAIAMFAKQLFETGLITEKYLWIPIGVAVYRLYKWPWQSVVRQAPSVQTAR